MLKLKIEEVLRFYDDQNRNDTKQVSSITGIVGEDLAASLLKYYLEKEGNIVSILDRYPSEKKETERRKAKQLDRWVKVISNDKTIFYQTEIKNWSSHSLGGKKLDLNCSDQKLIDYAHDRFKEEWDNSQKTFKKNYVSKVLKIMRDPDGFNDSDTIYPLVCYWFPIIPNTQNDLKPFNCIQCNKDVFTTVFFFSMSIYLRELLKTQEEINIETPNIELRLKKINQMFKEVKPLSVF